MGGALIDFSRHNSWNGNEFKKQTFPTGLKRSVLMRIIASSLPVKVRMCVCVCVDVPTWVTPLVLSFRTANDLIKKSVNLIFFVRVPLDVSI